MCESRWAYQRLTLLILGVGLAMLPPQLVVAQSGDPAAALEEEPAVTPSLGRLFTYRETTDGVEQTTRVKILPSGKKSTLEVEYFDSSWHLTTNPDLEVLECTVVGGDNDRTTIFRRRGNLVVVRSGEAGSVESVDNLPWLQTPFNLSSFILSGAKSVKYLTASVSDELGDDEKPGSVITLVAKNNGRETIDWNGNPMETDRVTITLTGIKSLFWKITYWYRPDDGIVLRYKEARGGPGTPDTFGVLVREETISR